jgi:hypothetical protein
LAIASFDMADLSASSLVRAEMRASLSPPAAAIPPSRSLSDFRVASDACRLDSSSSSDLPLPFSRLSRLVISAICRVRRRSAVSLPLASWLT